MAGSTKPGPQVAPIDCTGTPPRTPGSLGINDQADPNLTTLLGDTPGALGWLDGADPALPLYSSANPYTNLVCRDPTGDPLAVGFKLSIGLPVAANAAPQYIGLDDAQDIALKITTYFEVGHSMNYQGLAGDGDGQGTSFGILQWNFGQNTLGPLLKKMYDKNQTAFEACFGAGAGYDTFKKALLAGSQKDELKWARDLLKNNRAAWESAFLNLGANTDFDLIQRQQALAYHSNAVGCIKDLRKICADLFQNIELRSYAALFDLCVQQGSIHNLRGSIKTKINHDQPATQLDAMKIVVTITADDAKDEYVSDCLSRRMGILAAAPYKSTENKVTRTRKNPQLSLIAASGTKYVTGL